jgi:hypothetical protein
MIRNEQQGSQLVADVGENVFTKPRSQRVCRVTFSRADGERAWLASKPALFCQLRLPGIARPTATVRHSRMYG